MNSHRNSTTKHSALVIVSLLTVACAAQGKGGGATLQAKDVLGKSLADAKRLLGEPYKEAGAEVMGPGSLFFHAKGLLAFISTPGTTADVKGVVEFQFDRTKFKTWQAASAAIGLSPKSAQLKGKILTWPTLPGWRAAWNPPKCFSGTRNPRANALVFVGPEMGGEMPLH